MANLGLKPVTLGKHLTKTHSITHCVTVFSGSEGVVLHDWRNLPGVSGILVIQGIQRAQSHALLW